jgi:outer membrane immunogenic protein
MKRLLLRVLTLLAIGGIAQEAKAGDLPYPPPPPPPIPPRPYYTVPQQPLDWCSWAGPYLGGNLGYAWGDVSSALTKPSGFVGGIQGGYNWQNGPWVFGVEGDLQVTGADDRFAPWKFSNPWFGTIRGRAGYTFGNVLFYGTAGLAFGELRAETFFSSESHVNAGVAIGLGTEFNLATFGVPTNWSAKIEYLYVDLSQSSFVNTGVSNGYRFGVFRAGVNYHF